MYKKVNKLSVLFNFFVVGIFVISNLIFVVPSSFAEEKQGSNVQGRNVQGSKVSGGGADKVALENPLTNTADKLELPDLFGRLVLFMLGLVGSLSLIAFIAGGMMWLSSGGNMEQVNKGKNIFMYAAIGLAVVFGSYAILKFVFGALTGS